MDAMKPEYFAMQLFILMVYGGSAQSTTLCKSFHPELLQQLILLLKSILMICLLIGEQCVQFLMPQRALDTVQHQETEDGSGGNRQRSWSPARF
jgi:hypothetical protein